MEIQINIQKKKEIYSSIIEFIDTIENAEIDPLIKVFEKQDIFKNKEEIVSTFQLLSKIADNHCRLPGFFDKLGQIIQFLIKEKQSEISDLDIYDIFRNNKRILLFLLEQGLIGSDETMISYIMRSYDKNKFPYSHYLYSGIKSFIDENESKKIESEIKQKYCENINEFIEKCRIGENDSYICSLIRQDSVEEFISYVNRNNISLSSQILPSIFETNLFLMGKNPTLIQYASFFGSIQIIQYLKYNKIPLMVSLWYNVIHSNNAELIHFLEENELQPEIDNSTRFYSFFLLMNEAFKNKCLPPYESIYKESIICHHNAIADYIKDNYLKQSQIDNMSQCIIENYNYFYFPNDINSLISKSNNTNGFSISQLCFSFTQITIPSTITSIRNSAFYHCQSLTQITIPSSITSIGDYAFFHCSKLTNITIPSSVIEIGSSAFERCSSLKQITIPSSVTSIGNSAFLLCIRLTTIIIPSSVTSICYSTFEKCSSLIEITIPSSVKSIGNYAFSLCSSLTKITIPSSVEIFGENIFNGIISLDITGDIKCIPNKLFERCSSLTQISIPSSVTYIGDYSFYGCSSLKQISIPSSVTYIGENAFSYCTSLKQISIPSSVTYIGENAFSYCTSLKQISIPSSINMANLQIPLSVNVTTI